MKICSKCGEEKEYPSAFTAGVTEYSHCNLCQRLYTRAHYAENKQQYLERNRRRRDDVVAKVDLYLLEHPCVDCGERDIVVLDFDHVRGKKKGNISSMRMTYPWSTVQKEIAKCEIRCANCHRRRTFGPLAHRTERRSTKPERSVQF